MITNRKDRKTFTVQVEENAPLYIEAKDALEAARKFSLHYRPLNDEYQAVTSYQLTGHNGADIDEAGVVAAVFGCYFTWFTKKNGIDQHHRSRHTYNIYVREITIIR